MKFIAPYNNILTYTCTSTSTSRFRPLLCLICITNIAPLKRVNWMVAEWDTCQSKGYSIPTLKLTVHVPIPIERGCDSKVSCPTTQLNAPGQAWTWTAQSRVGKYKTWTPGPWTPSMDRVHQNMDRVHGPLSWTGSMDPLFLLPLKLLIRSKQK